MIGRYGHSKPIFGWRTIELLMVDYGIEAKQKVEVDNADIERFFVEDGYLNEDKVG